MNLDGCKCDSDCSDMGDEMSNEYLILMDSDECCSFSNNFSEYKGAITIIDSVPWYCTGVAGPTMFDTEKNAQSIANVLHEKYPEHSFDIASSDFYLSIINPKWSCPWLEILRQEQ